MQPKKITYHLHMPAIIPIQGHETAIPLNLYSLLRDSSEVITPSDASQNSTRLQCYFCHLQTLFIDYFDDPIPDDVVIYAGDVFVPIP